MTEKTLGYVELEWTCKRCGTKNPGGTRTCTNCGSPMDAGDQFTLPDQQVLITDKSRLEEVKRGPDILCPYCGTRNQAGAPVCTQCSGDLTVAQAREAGQVMGAYQSDPVPDITCPACGTPNPTSAGRCKNCGSSLIKEPAAAPLAGRTKTAPRIGLLAGFALLAVLLCAGLAAILILANRTTATTATVQDLHWERSIQILELRPAEHETWKDQIPVEAELGICTDRLRETRPEPAPGSVEVCGTPYTVDQGDGTGKVVQECSYQIYDDWCSYALDEWQVTNSTLVEGSGLNPAWPKLSLQEDQQEGNRSESYAVTFITEQEGKTYIYRTSDSAEYLSFAPGSRWDLQINTFGSVVDVQPK